MTPPSVGGHVRNLAPPPFPRDRAVHACGRREATRFPRTGTCPVGYLDAVAAGQGGIGGRRRAAPRVLACIRYLELLCITLLCIGRKGELADGRRRHRCQWTDQALQERARGRR